MSKKGATALFFAGGIGFFVINCKKKHIMVESNVLVLVRNF